jgi:hypothetical protein
MRSRIRSRAIQKEGRPVTQEHDLPLEEYHRGLGITNGNPEIYRTLFSRRDDLTLANPLVLPPRGWSEVSETLDRAAEKYRDGVPWRVAASASRPRS